VAAGEAVVELETDKVDLEIGAEQDGVLARIERQAGEDVKIGDVLGIIEPGGESADKSPSGVKASAGPGGAEAPVKGSTPAADQTPGVSVDKGDVRQAPPDIGRITPAGPEKVTPVARRLAEEHSVNLAQVPGTGPSGRVTRQDVENYVEGRKADDRPPTAVSRQPSTFSGEPTVVSHPPPLVTEPALQSPRQQGVGSLSKGHPSRDEERVRMSRRRRTIAQRLVEAQRTAAILTTFNEVDMSAVMALRARRKESFKERHGVGLGIVSFFVKASIGALRDFPRLNAEIQGDEMVFKHYYDIGIAIGDAEGLVVPVLRAADHMSFAEIERAIKEFVQKAGEGALSLEDLRGGTFTISNGGVYGSLLSTPILNPPQAGILGLHKIEERPIAFKGEVVVRPMMYVALSYDHRIVDGREAVQFLVRVKEFIEDPEAMLLEG